MPVFITWPAPSVPVQGQPWLNSGKKGKVVSYLLSPRSLPSSSGPLCTPAEGAGQDSCPEDGGHTGVAPPAQASRVTVPLPGALSTDPHQLQPHTGGLHP